MPQGRGTLHGHTDYCCTRSCCAQVPRVDDQGPAASKDQLNVLVSNDRLRWSSGFDLEETALWPGPVALPPTGYLVFQVPKHVEIVAVTMDSLKPVISAALRFALQRFAPALPAGLRLRSLLWPLNSVLDPGTVLRFTDVQLHAYGLHWDSDAELAAFVRKLGAAHPRTVVFIVQTSSRSLAMMSEVAAKAWMAETGRGLPAVISFSATSPQLRCERDARRTLALGL